jgi:phage terminase large subunit
LISCAIAEVEVDDSVFLPCFQHLRDDTGIDIDLIYGGRDSGKSRDEAQRLVLKCLEDDYFRHILVRKTANTIKDSQWQVIKDVVEEWNLESVFTFLKAPLEIHCANGNKFIARGLDEPMKLKSIANPSGAWVEEGNQISEDDFTFLLTTLRSNEGRIKLDFTFNPESDTPDYKDFWIYKNFFSDRTEKSFTFTKLYQIGDQEFNLTYRATHTTYRDNPFVTEQRKAIHESLKATNFYWYKVFTLGEWGNRLNEAPWAFAFNRQKHAKAGLERNIGLPLFLSWDFNRNPVCCSVIQHLRDIKTIRVLETIKIPNSGVDELCNMILVKYPKALYIVTGDYSGHTPTSVFKEQVTNYTMIKTKLRLSDSQIKTKVNPSLEKNRTLVNIVLQYYGVEIDEHKAKDLIFDLENVEASADGKILKENRKDPKQQADILDTFRYLINLEMVDFEKQYMLPERR